MSQPSPKQADEPNAWMWDKHFDALVRYKDGPGGGNPNRPRGHVLSSHLPAAFLLVSSSFYLVMSRPTYSAGVLIEESNLVELKGKTLEYGEAFFFGNSVTRHYAFSFCHGDHEHIRERSQEKSMCIDEVGHSSCDMHCIDGHTVRFRWANLLCSETSTDPRDACSRFKTTESCFASMFGNATVKDLLIIGSVPIEGMPSNLSKQIWDKPFDIQVPVWREYLDAHKIAGFLLKVLKYFPGDIRWLSFAFLKIEEDVKGAMVQKHLIMLREINDDIARAVELVNDPRLTFVDVWDLQKQNVAKYADLIHHPGALSVKIVEQIILSILEQRNVNFVRGNYTHALRSQK